MRIGIAVGLGILGIILLGIIGDIMGISFNPENS